MGCITRECLICDYADGNLPPLESRYDCPKCGNKLQISFDEWECREEYYCDDDCLEEEEKR